MVTKIAKKLSNHRELICSAFEGEVDLRNNFKLYRKIYSYYVRSGVSFTGDSNVDYNIVLNYLYEDLFS